MIQLQFDESDLSGKIASHVGRANVQSSDTMGLEMSFDHHRSLPFKLR